MSMSGLLILLSLVASFVSAFLNLWLGVMLRTQSVLAVVCTLAAFAACSVASLHSLRHWRSVRERKATTESPSGTAGLTKEQRLLFASWTMLAFSAVMWGCGLLISPSRPSSLETLTAPLREAQQKILGGMESRYQGLRTEEERRRYRRGFVDNGTKIIPFVLDLMDYSEDAALRGELVVILEEITGLSLKPEPGKRPGAEHEIRRKVEAWVSQQEADKGGGR